MGSVPFKKGRGCVGTQPLPFFLFCRIGQQKHLPYHPIIAYGWASGRGARMISTSIISPSRRTVRVMLSPGLV